VVANKEIIEHFILVFNTKGDINYAHPTLCVKKVLFLLSKVSIILANTLKCIKSKIFDIFHNIRLVAIVREKCEKKSRYYQSK
jgi:hypothetical protein